MNDVIRTPEELGEAIRAVYASASVMSGANGALEICVRDEVLLIHPPESWRQRERFDALAAAAVSGNVVILCGTDEDFRGLGQAPEAAPLRLLTLPTSRVRLEHAVASYLELGTLRRQAREHGRVVDRFRYEVGELISTARVLSTERDMRKLLGIILEKSRQVTGADAGSVYVLEGEGSTAEKKLHFMASQNDSLKIDFKEFILPVDGKSIVGAAALGRKPINIPDLYRLGESGHNPWGFTHNRSFDEKTGYRARSMLTVPMLSARTDTIGVIQLINKKRTPSKRLSTIEDFEAEVMPFDARSEEFALALASQAGISLETAMLYDEIRRLFEGFVDAAVTAIESRDPTTSGHSRRVATLTVGLAEAVDHLPDGPFGGVHFSPDDLKQIEFAGVLHDFGKVGVRENILVKAKKLYEWDRLLVQQRFAFIRKTLQVENLEWKLRYALEKSRDEAGARMQEIDNDFQARLAEVDGYLAFVLKANEPTVLDEGGFEKLVDIGRLQYADAGGEPRPYLTREEISALQVKRGSLTDVERLEIESHVSHTFKFLETIPWGRSLRAIPKIAGSHHEYLNGKGYPKGLVGDEIPVESRMMTIADIFDALTASDRPYKRAVPSDRALGIIESEVKAGKCDAELFKIFVGAEVFKRVL